MKIKNQTLMYLYRQEKCLGHDKEGCCNVDENHKIRYILSPYELKPDYGKMYTDMKENKEMTYDDWFSKNWYPYFSNFYPKDCEIIEETHCEGWDGLFNMLPVLNNGMCAEVVFTAEYEADIADDYVEEILEKQKDDIRDLLDKINHTATYECYVLKRRLDDVMLGWENDIPFYELDDGYVKWDVHNRANATLLFLKKSLCDLFDDNTEYDENGEYVPYKATVTISSNIKRL
jgi:hypothetical protein